MESQRFTLSAQQKNPGAAIHLGFLISRTSDKAVASVLGWFERFARAVIVATVAVQQ
jgi:hypothetical protein